MELNENELNLVKGCSELETLVESLDNNKEIKMSTVRDNVKNALKLLNKINI